MSDKRRTKATYTDVKVAFLDKYLFRKYILYRSFIKGTDINGIYDEKLRLLSGCY